MTILLDCDQLEGNVDQDLALSAMAGAFAAEAAGTTVLPPRTDTESNNGLVRVMPAVLDDVMGLKVMTLAEGLGTRYLVLLYQVKTGELLALLDADELTRLRTGATTALAARCMVDTPPDRLGVVGSGFEAVGQLRALAGLWALDRVTVFSPNEQRRTAFAEHMADELGTEVVPVGSSADATSDQQVVVRATKATEPVVDGATFAPGAVVLSTGSTRLVLRELDRATLARAGTVVGDDPDQLVLDSGDVADAIESGALLEERLVPLASAAGDASLLVTDEARDLLVFKSLGTALQDLALARAVYEEALAGGYGTDIGEVARLKPFAGT